MKTIFAAIKRTLYTFLKVTPASDAVQADRTTNRIVRTTLISDVDFPNTVTVIHDFGTGAIQEVSIGGKRINAEYLKGKCGTIGIGYVESEAAQVRFGTLLHAKVT